ncbi:hypothetical protein WDU94_007886 [Cyamophila willieti]
MFPIPRKKIPPHSPTLLPESPKTRKERCVGCTPKYFQAELQIVVPEERIPYDPPKPRLSRRRSSVLAQEEMKKEIDRLEALEMYRKKQNQDHFRTQRSISSSSQRTNSAETNSKNQNKSQLRNQKYDNEFPPTNQKSKNTKRTGQVSNLKLSTVETFSRSDEKNGNTGKRTKNITGAVSNKKIELKKDALELVLIFPAQSKVTKTRTRQGYAGKDDVCLCPRI